MSVASSGFETRQKLLQLEALYDIGRALNTLRPESELLEELMYRGMSVLDATVGFVVSIDEEMRIQNLLTAGVDAPANPGAILDLEPVRRALQLREPIMSSIGEFFGGPGGAIAVAPLVAAETIVGVVGLVGKESRGDAEGRFLEEDLRFLGSIASIGAVAVDNARNYHRLEMMRESLEDENRSLKARMQRDYSDRLMIGDSPQMQRVIDLVARVADSAANVLIRGESGTGKEMVARLVHVNSSRRQKPFVAINCAALPETLLESELFGIERGVATGVDARPGKFEIADGGTVFLDEIGDIPLTLQAKLLRVLQEREVEKLGGRRRIEVDVRILAATHRNLEEMVESGGFRQDLYYRLKVVEISLPPLRERRQDIPKLVRYFLDKYGEKEGLHDARITQSALHKLMQHPFPGNVRELENMIEGALALTLDPVIDDEDLLLDDVSGGLGPAVGEDVLVSLADLEAHHIQRVLRATEGNVSRAARILGVDRKTVYRKLNAMGQNAS